MPCSTCHQALRRHGMKWDCSTCDPDLFGGSTEVDVVLAELVTSARRARRKGATEEQITEAVRAL